jgi:hypothetical protein
MKFSWNTLNKTQHSRRFGDNCLELSFACNKIRSNMYYFQQSILQQVGTVNTVIKIKIVWEKKEKLVEWHQRKIL